MKRPLIVWVGVAGIVLVGLVALLGGNTESASAFVTGVLLWMLPGAIVGEVLMQVGRNIHRDFLAPFGVGAAAGAAIGFLLRIIVWLG